MSIRVMTRVWDTARAEGGALLVLLALADYADDDGYAYPKEAQIAAKARLSDRQVRTVIKTLAERGELAYHTSQGRNTRSWYVVLSGLDDTTKAERISGLSERSNRNIIPEISSAKKENRKFATGKTGSLRQEKPEVFDTKTGSFRHKNRKFCAVRQAVYRFLMVQMTFLTVIDPSWIRHMIRHRRKAAAAAAKQQQTNLTPQPRQQQTLKQPSC